MEIDNSKISNELFIEGYFESEKYFNDIKQEIKDEFNFINANKYIKSILHKLNQKNSVSICLRQNRF